MMTCPACDSPQAEDRTECLDCGVSLISSPAEAAFNPLGGLISSAPSAASIVTEAGSVASDLQVENERESDQGSGSRRRPALVIMTLIVLVAIGFSAYRLTLDERHPWEILLEKARRYAERVETLDKFKARSAFDCLARFEQRAPEVVARARALHQPLAPEASTSLHALSSAYLERAAFIDPDWGMWLGVHPHPPGITQMDAESDARMLLLSEEVISHLQSLTDAQELTPHEVTDQQLLIRLIETMLPLESEDAEGSEAYDTALDAAKLQRIELVFDLFPLLVTFECCPEPQRMNAATTRLAAAIERLATLPAELRAPPRSTLMSVARRTGSIRTYLEQYPARWESPSLELTALCRAAIDELERFERALLDDVLPRSSSTSGIGPEAYAQLLRRRSALPFGAKELVDSALSDFTAACEESWLLGAHFFPPAQIATPAFKQLVQADTGKTVTRLESALSHWIGKTPIEDPGILIEPAPVHWAGDGSGFFLAPGPLAPREPQLKPRFLQVPLPDFPVNALALYDQHTIAHEVYPGHHLHHVLASASGCDLREAYDCRISLEGWAIYAVALSHETGYHEEHSALDDIERNDERTTLAMNAALEVLIHTRAASSSEMLELLKLYYGDDSLTLADVGDRSRYAGYDSAYFVGFRAIMRLREAVEEHEGDEFDRARFHRRLLEAGYVPPDLLAVEFTR